MNRSKQRESGGIWVMLLGLAVAGLACLSGCDLLAEAVCDELHIEDATTSDLVTELFGRGVQDLGGWLDGEE